VFSYLITLTTWHCLLHSPATAAITDQSPAGRAHSSKPTAASMLQWANAQTDRRTQYRFIEDPGSANKHTKAKAN